MFLLVFVVLFIFIFVLLAWLLYWVKYCRNPYKLIMVFGKKGSGKSTFLAKTAYGYLKKGYHVYTSIPVPGCILFKPEQIGEFTFPENSVIFIDEVGMIWDNRNFKNFSTKVRDYFKLQRHEKHIVYLFSQTFDIDVKLRNLTDRMYLLTSHMGFISCCRSIKRSITIVNPIGDAESRIADSLEFEPIWLSIFGAKTFILTFIPRWAPLFDSYSKIGLPLLPKRDPAPSVKVKPLIFSLFSFKKRQKNNKVSKIKTLFVKIKSRIYGVFKPLFRRRLDPAPAEILPGEDPVGSCSDFH